MAIMPYDDSKSFLFLLTQLRKPTLIRMRLRNAKCFWPTCIVLGHLRVDFDLLLT
jgi:hypothetical protein